MTARELLEIVTTPEDGHTLKSWVRQPLLWNLLQDQREGDGDVILYGTAFNRSSILIHAVLVPLKRLSPPDPDDLMAWSCSPFDSWGCGLVWGGGRPARVEMTLPLSSADSKTISQGEQLIFARSFDGRAVDQHYYELAHSLTHAHGLHWTPERRAWCRFDDSGDVENVIRLEEIGGIDGYGDAAAIVIPREILEMHMAATQTALVQMIDSTCVSSDFGGWGKEQEFRYVDASRDLYCRLGGGGHEGSYIRGVQVLRPRESATELGTRLHAQERGAKDYATFLTHDVKNQRLVQVSCSPDALASYFQPESPLPLQISPAFFNAQVLDKYKADPEKYRLGHRSISCRNAWSLQTYDINEAGQVHTYITYLGRLPHAEQLYWKSFNEAPKASISKRAFTTDIQGSWDTEHDPLQALVRLLGQLSSDRVPWFKLRQQSLPDQLHYPVTDSVKLWADALLNLAKVLVEGLEKTFFTAELKSLGRVAEPQWGTIKLAEAALAGRGIDGEIIDQAITPLRELQGLRTKLSAHAGATEAAGIRAALLREHGSPKAHVAALCDQLTAALEILRSVFGGGKAKR